MEQQDNKDRVVVFLLEEIIRGGLITACSELSKIFIDLGYRVKVIYFEQDDVDIKNYLGHIPSRDILNLKTTSKNRYFVQFEKIIRYLKGLNKMEGEIRNSLCIYYCFLPTSYLAVLLYPRSWNALRIFHFLGFRDLEVRSVHKFKLQPYLSDDELGLIIRCKAFVLYYVQRLCWLSCSHIIALSDYVKGELVNRYQIPDEKISIIPLSVDVSIFKKQSSRVRGELGLSKKCQLIVNIQRHDPRKGLLLFLESLASLTKKNVWFRAIIASDSTYHTRDLYSYADRLGLKFKVTFISGLDRPEVVKVFNSADLSIMSSLDLETFGQSIIESFACGCPVVGTPTGAIPELLNQVRSHDLCAKKAQSDSLAEAMFSYLTLPLRVKNQVKREVVSLARSKYSTDNIRSDYIKLFQKLVQ